MKTDSHRLFTVAPPQERAILDQIRDDDELVARLNITPQEIEALSKCSFLGTLTCKEDMLFILRQIREATSPSSSEQMPVLLQPYSEDEEQEDPLPDFRQIQSRFAPEIISEPGSLESLARRRLSERTGVLFVAAIVAVALFWNGIVAMSRWRETFVTKVGMPVSHAACFRSVVQASGSVQRSALVGDSIRAGNHRRDLHPIFKRPQALQSQTGLALLIEAMLSMGTNGKFRPKNRLKEDTGQWTRSSECL